jgi:hypothetical protein
MPTLSYAPTKAHDYIGLACCKHHSILQKDVIIKSHVVSLDETANAMQPDGNTRHGFMPAG